jgi:signal transduction histidine kinase
MARRLSATDRLLLGGLLPLYLVAVVLHGLEVARSGLAQLPVYVTPARDGGYPTVGGYRIETDPSGSGLELGDRLVRVGDADLRGAGFLRFDAIALARTTPDRPTRLVFERGGAQHEVLLRARPHAHPWFRIPTLVMILAVCALVLLRGPGTRSSRLFVAAFGSYGLVQAQFYGGPEWKTLASLWIWNFLGPVSAVLVLRWAASFPDEVAQRRRSWAGWPWLGGLLYLAVRLNYLYGAPLDAHVVPRVSFASNAVFILGTLALLARSYRHADPVGRRRIKWVLYGAAMGGLPLSAVELAGGLAPELERFPQLFALAGIATAAAPICLLIGIVRHNAFDIDRLIGATATYSLTLAAVAGGLLVGMPAAGRFLAAALQVPVAAVQLGLTALLLAVAFPLGRRLRPQVDRLFFPERRALELGVAQLLADLSDCRAPQQVLELIRDRVGALLRPDRCALYTRDGPRFGTHDDAGAPLLEAGGALLADLSLRPVPRRAASLRERRDVASAAERALLDALGDGVLLPLHRGRELAAFLALGPKRSRDVYTATDLSLLAAVAENASAGLRRLRDRERLRSERARRREVDALRESAESAQRARTRLLAAASHDLRQPLHAIGLFAEALGQRLSDPEARRLLDRIESANESLQEMFGELLDLGRLEAGALAADPRDVPVGPLLDRVAGELAPVAARKGIGLRSVASSLVVRSDPLLLARIVRNLASNAVRYTERGRVLLGARRAGDAVRIEVWDTGPGIPAEHRERIFQEFVRFGSADAQGLGLGLAIVKGLAERLGHPLVLRSELGLGSLFAVVAPRVRIPAAQAVAAAAPALDLGGLRVLVVDDDRDALESLAAVLEGWGCDVQCARTPLDALGRVRPDAKLDAVVCDLQLGASSGLDLIEALRHAAGAAIPALVVSGTTAAPDRDAVRARGLAFLGKPVSPARLRAALWNLTR